MPLANINTWYDDHCLKWMRKRNYDKAAEGLREFLAMPQAPLYKKLGARYLLAQCLTDRLESAGYDKKLALEFTDNLQCYWNEVAEYRAKPDAQLGYGPFCDYFRQVLRFALFSKPLELTRILPEYLIDFEERTAGLVTRWDLLHVWVEEVDRERRGINSLRKDHILRAIIMGQAMLGLLNEEHLLPLHSVINKILADTIYAYHGDSITLQDRASRALEHLEAVLRDNPGDAHALNFREEIRQTLAKRSQVDRFSHDARSLLGSLNHLSSKLLDFYPHTSPIAHDMHDMHRIITTLRAVTMLAEAQDNPVRVSSDEYAKQDIVLLIKGQLRDHHWPEDCLETKGTCREWELLPGMVSVVFDNLLKNSLEAYNRNKLKIPSKPCRILVDYDLGQIDYYDEAGGISPILGDIFTPYTSSKEIQSGVGLGLCSARMAMRAQEGNLTLAKEQPRNGVHFIITFFCEMQVQ